MGFNDYKRFLNSAIGCGKTTAMCEAIVSYQKKNPDKVCTVVMCEPQSLNKYNYMSVLERLGADLDKVEFISLEDVFKANKRNMDPTDPTYVTKLLARPTFICHECYDFIIRDLLNSLETVQSPKQFKDVQEWKEI